MIPDNLSRLLVTVLLCLLSLPELYAQKDDHAIPLKKKKTFFVGPKAEYYQAGLSVQQRVDRYSITNSTDLWEGYRLGVFARKEYPRLLLQSELSYAYNTAFVSFYNHTPDSNDDMRPGEHDWIITGTGYTFRKAELALLAGYKQLRWLHVQAGPIVSYTFFDGFYRKKPGQHYNPNDQILYSFAESYRNVTLSGRISLGVELGQRLLVNGSYERSLTPLSKQIRYHGQTYALRQHSGQLMIGVGYKLLGLFPAHAQELANPVTSHFRNTGRLGINYLTLDMPDNAGVHYQGQYGRYTRNDRFIFLISAGYLAIQSDKNPLRPFNRKRITTDASVAVAPLKLGERHHLRIGAGLSVWYRDDAVVRRVSYSVKPDGTSLVIDLEMREVKTVDAGPHYLLEYEYRPDATYTGVVRLGLANLGEAGYSSLMGVALGRRF
jgi:hypothetical protein